MSDKRGGRRRPEPASQQALASPENEGASVGEIADAPATAALGIDIPLDEDVVESDGQAGADVQDGAFADLDAVDEELAPVGVSHADETEAEDEHEAEAEPVPQLARDRMAYPALGNVTAIGTAGRQPQVVAMPGPNSTGVSDSELDFQTIEPFEVRGCSTRGYSHRHAGTPRQDAFAVLATDTHLVVAVADGVSQGEQSHVAAQVAARGACKLAAESPNETDWDQLSRRISMSILREAHHRQALADLDGEADLDEQMRACRLQMSTTLVVLVISREADVQGAFAATLAVVAGDSGAYLVDGGRLWPVVGGKVDDGSTITSSAVRPLPGVVRPQTCDLALVEGQAIVLVSDGVGDPLGEGDNDLGLELAARWAVPPPIDQYLVDVNFYRSTFDDDRTAVGIWVLPPS